MLSKNPRAIKRRATMMRKLGWDGDDKTYDENLKKYRLYMAGVGREGGAIRVPKGYAITKRVEGDAKG